MSRRILFAALGMLVTVTTLSQCPDKNQLWGRLVYLASNASSNLSHDQLNEQLKELLKYEAGMKYCAYRNDSTHALLLQRIGAMYFKQGELVKAIQFTKQSVELISTNYYSPAVNPKLLIRDYYSLSLYYGQLNNIKEKFSSIDSCVNISTRLKSVDYFYLFALSEKLEHLFNIGDYERCYDFAELGERAISSFSRGSDSANYVFNYLTLKINVLFNFKNYDLAERLLTHAIDDFQRVGARQHLGTICELLGQLYTHKHNAEKANTFYHQAVTYDLQQGFNLGCMQALNNLGYMYYNDAGNYTKAIENYRTALSYANNDKTYSDDQRLESLNILANIADVYVSTDNLDSAFYYFRLAFSQINNGIDENGLAGNLESFISNKRTGYLTALVIRKGNAFLQKYKKVKDALLLDEAIRVFKTGDRLLDRLRAEQSEVQSKLFWRQESRHLYEGAIEACLLKNNGEDAFYFFEKSRAVLLHDQLLEQGWLAEKDILMQNQIKKKIVQLERESKAPESKTVRQAEIQNELLAQKQDIDRLQKSIKIQNPLYFQSFLDTSFITLAQVRSNILNNHEGMLELFTGDSAIYTLMITENQVRLAKINKEEFESTVNAYLKYLSDAALINRDYNGYLDVSRKLYVLIFKSTTIPAGRLIISPDSYYFPFESLVSSKSADAVRYLVQDFAVSYTYSARFLMNRFTSGSGIDAHNFLGIAPVNFQSNTNLPSLPGSDKSLQKIDSYFSDAAMLESAQATKKNFLDNFYKYQVIQLYSHASDSSSNGEPAIYFSDSTLYLSDLISSINPVTRLIVLSACKTGAGRLYQGEGVFSFNRQFAALGIPLSIINLWSVDNESTYRLTEQFYKYLSDGMPADLALQKAKINFLETSGKEKQLPYYWAASVLAGKTDVVQLQESHLWRWVAIVVGVSILVFMIIRIIKKRSKVYIAR